MNAHIHLPPNFSAFKSIEEVLERASNQNIGVLGTSNYYDYSAYTPFTEKALAVRVFPLFGIEVIVKIDELVEQGININDPGVPGKMYFCGKGITRFLNIPEPAKSILAKIRKDDADLIAGQIATIARLFEEYGLNTGLNPSIIKEQIATRHACSPKNVYIQERHVTQAFQQALFGMVPDHDQRLAAIAAILGTPIDSSHDDEVAVQGLLRTHLMKAGKPAYREASMIDFDQGYEMILAMGGIPCYPVLIDGTSPINPYEAEPTDLIAHLEARDVHFAEFIPLRNEAEILSRYVMKMREAGIVITVGTEHNTMDMIPLTPTCRNAVPISEELQEIFYEGACVVAAHQYHSARNETGYVDEHGQLNNKYTDTEERIAAFAHLGQSVLNTVIAP